MKCSVREQEAIILYALLKGYKMNVGGLIEGSIRGYHLSNKKGLIPHPATISKLCILAGVRGSWDGEETCPKASPLTLTGVTKGPRNKKQKGIVELEAEPAEENNNREMETVPEQIPPAEEEEMPFRMSPLNQSGLELREDFPELEESSRKDAGNIEIMEMLRSIKKDMEEMEQKWEKHQRIRDEFLEAEFRRKEQLLEQTQRQREEEWREEMKMREKEFGEKMKASLEAFYNNQFRRDEEVLTIMRKREVEMEGNMLKKIEAFKYLPDFSSVAKSPKITQFSEQESLTYGREQDWGNILPTDYREVLDKIN